MRIIPAIDIVDGKCVRLTQGDYAQKKIYNESPLEVAKQFEQAGLRYLHLVDLDGARDKRIVNHKVLELITRQTSLKVDFGGGIKSDNDIGIAFECGAEQVTAGSVAVTDPNKVKEWMRLYGADRIIIGADVNKGKLAISGWKEQTDIEIINFLRAYVEAGIRSVISTDIQKDGMLQGPSFELYTQLINEFSALEVIASGGVTTVNDLDQLKEIGVSGVILGKAIYEGFITLNKLAQYAD